MFDSESDPAVLLLQRVCSAARAEACAAATRLVAIADLVSLRLAQDGGAADGWVVDATDAVTLEISTVLRCSRRWAASQVRTAHALRFQLPELGRRFIAGDIDEYVFRACVFRTGLIADEAVLARVDARLAARVPSWGVVARSQLAGRIDRIVAGVDLDAVRRRADRLAGREVTVGDVDNGLAELNATLYSPDAFAVAARLRELAHTVCDGDPRSLAERCADAFAALAVGADRMPCRCGLPDCPAVGAVASAVVIHVIAEHTTLTGGGGAAVMPGHEGLIPPEMIAQLAKDARIRPLIHPGTATPESSYRPSRALAEFVRCRDVTCRFPHCDAPAFTCDVDHTIAYGVGGPTCASNLKCLCRFHHLAKTFWGWTDQQYPNGTVVWTSPAGQRIVTTPGSRGIVSDLCAPTAPVAAQRRAPEVDGGDRTVMMPRRRRTRAQQRAADITAERHANHQARTNPKVRWRPEEDYDLAEVEVIMLNQQPNPPPF